MALPDTPICARCGYDLVGIGDIGRCPECGSPFNLNTGEGMRHQGNAEVYSIWLGRRIRTILLGVMTAFMIMCTGVSAFFSKRGPWTGAVFVLIMALATLTSYIYERDSLPGMENEPDPQPPAPRGATASPRPLRPAPPPVPHPRCKKCKYDLSHSPIRGECPECGNPYDRGSLKGIVIPLTPQERAQLLRDRAIQGVVAVFCIFCAILAVALYWHVQGPQRTLWTAAVIVGAGALYIATRITLGQRGD